MQAAACAAVIFMSVTQCSTEICRSLLLTAALIAMAACSARAEVSIGAGARFTGDEWGYGQEQYDLELAHDTETSGQRLALSWFRYALREELEGIFAFEGNEPAAELGAHVLEGRWWLGASAGLQGTLDFEGVIAEAIVAHAIPIGETTLTPRIELAREPLSLHALPLSLGLHSHRVQGALGWRASGVIAEGGVRLDFWEGDTIENRVRNTARDVIADNRITTGYAYVLSDGGGWLDAGVAGKIASAARNTLLPTRLVPVRRYTWYPASAPPFVWETSLALRVHGDLVETLHAELKLSLPLVSQELRQWGEEQVVSWGTAPYEGTLELEWLVFAETSVQLVATLFVKPWESWDAIGDGAYRQGSVRVAVEQRI